MAIDPLGATASLLAALRAEVSRTPRPAKPGAAAEVAESAAAAVPRRRDAALLRKELRDILKGVAPGDEQAMGSARARVVRAVLLWEFGSELREHGEWQPMLDTLVSTLEASPAHRQTLAQLIHDLSK